MHIASYSKQHLRIKPNAFNYGTVGYFSSQQQFHITLLNKAQNDMW